VGDLLINWRRDRFFFGVPSFQPKPGCVHAPSNASLTHSTLLLPFDLSSTQTGLLQCFFRSSYSIQAAASTTGSILPQPVPTMLPCPTSIGALLLCPMPSPYEKANPHWPFAFAVEFVKYKAQFPAAGKSSKAAHPTFSWHNWQQADASRPLPPVDRCGAGRAGYDDNAMAVDLVHEVGA